MLNGSLAELKPLGSSVRGEREMVVGSLGRGPNVGEDIEAIPGYCEWKPSAAIGYLEGGRDPGCKDGGTLFRLASRKGDETCGLVDMAVCDGLELFCVVVTGDCTTSPLPFSCCCAAACAAAWASCSRRRYLQTSKIVVEWVSGVETLFVLTN